MKLVLPDFAMSIMPFQPARPFLIAIDSDGCVFDTMEIKHKECFIPLFIKEFGLQAVSSYARECAEFVNLYSQTRGVNRFPAYLLTLDLMRSHPVIQQRNFHVPMMSGLKDWVSRETKLSTKSISQEAENTGNPDIIVSARWSSLVDQWIAEMVHDIPPFPYVRETLAYVSSIADVIVCSATPVKALEKEWSEHGISPFVRMIYGQEAGSKKEILTEMLKFGYPPDHIMMIGDSPGDMQAAKSTGVLSYPVTPHHEAKSWELFLREIADNFFSGKYAGKFHQKYLEEYDQVLPVRPDWI